MSKHDLDWLVEEHEMDEETAVDLLQSADWAEMERLIDKFGYPKDNEFSPPLEQRLRSPKFRETLREGLRDSGRDDLEAVLTELLKKLGL